MRKSKHRRIWRILLSYLDTSNQITSAAFIKKHNLRSASSVQSAIKKLLEYHLVSTSQATYYIDDQLMGLWLKM